jgi:hypothetical protein
LSRAFVFANATEIGFFNFLWLLCLSSRFNMSLRLMISELRKFIIIIDLLWVSFSSRLILQLLSLLASIHTPLFYRSDSSCL